MAIKSLDELMQIKNQHKNKTNLRHGGNARLGGHAEILVGMATCGIAAGARETLNEIIKELNAHSRQDVKVVPVGCIGFCKYEPTIQINMPGCNSVVYGNVKKETVKTIIESHIINGIPVESMII